MSSSQSPGPDHGVVASTTRIVILHRHRMLREGLSAAIVQHPGFLVTASAADVAEILREGALPPADVFVLDLCSPSHDGLKSAREIQAVHPQSKILMIGVAEVDSDLIASVEAGALGCLPQDASLSDLVDSIRAVAAGEALCSPKLTRLLLRRVAQTAGESMARRLALLPRLTTREREIVSLIEAGQANKEIAAQLRISPQTVKNHVHNVLEKLQVDTRRDAARRAREHGLLQSPAL